MSHPFISWCKSIWTRYRSAAVTQEVIAAAEASDRLSQLEISAIRKATETLAGSWIVKEYTCDCRHECNCDWNEITVTPDPAAGEKESPAKRFSVWRENNSIRLVLIRFNDHKYEWDFWSLPAVLAVMRAIVVQGADAKPEAATPPDQDKPPACPAIACGNY